MDMDTAHAAALEQIVVKYRHAIEGGDPWSGDSPLDADTLHAVSLGAATTYELGKLAADLDDPSTRQLRLQELLATAFAHGFNTASTYQVSSGPNL
ncbi:hypothetical protein [Streptomyces sp. NPDC059788]|uniref:hypothetical protein n=1 Tax=Streptomyces sp. NPDC059788 TaxID=3346948 RepID=UPI00365BB066